MTGRPLFQGASTINTWISGIRSGHDG